MLHEGLTYFSDHPQLKHLSHKCARRQAEIVQRIGPPLAFVIGDSKHRFALLVVKHRELPDKLSKRNSLLDVLGHDGAVALAFSKVLLREQTPSMRAQVSLGLRAYRPGWHRRPSRPAGQRGPSRRRHRQRRDRSLYPLGQLQGLLLRRELLRPPLRLLRSMSSMRSGTSWIKTAAVLSVNDRSARGGGG